MRLDVQHALIPLHPARPLRLLGLHGARLQSSSGTCWVTVDGDPVDRVLAAGEAWTVDTRQPVVVSALGVGATLEVDAGPATRRRPGRVAAGGAQRRLGLGFALP
jgi:Protein of unknown function (DUF2917)